MGDYIGRAIATMIIVAFVAGAGLSVGGYFLISWLAAHLTLGWV